MRVWPSNILMKLSRWAERCCIALWIHSTRQMSFDCTTFAWTKHTLIQFVVMYHLTRHSSLSCRRDCSLNIQMWWCRFFLCLLIAYITHVVSVSQFRAISSICRTLVLSNTAAFMLVLMAFLFGGIIIPKREALFPGNFSLASLIGDLRSAHQCNLLRNMCGLFVIVIWNVC